jgi:hypothetical protein
VKIALVDDFGEYIKTFLGTCKWLMIVRRRDLERG